MKKHQIILALFIVLSSLAIFSCKDPDPDTDDTFDRKEMLTNFVNNLMLPSFTNLQNKTITLQSKINNFSETFTATSLIEAQEAWLDAYLSFQSVNAYNLGIASENGTQKSLVEELGTFPVSETKIETAIADNQFNFTDFNRDARGFLTLEYLLFDANDDNNLILSKFDSNPNRIIFLKALIAHIAQKNEEVVAYWTNQNISTFVNNNGTDVGSSTSLFYNEFVKSYETIKNLKVALPIGKRSGQTQSEPKLVEAYYSGYSFLLLKNHFQNMVNIWNGTLPNGVDGTGFKEYLKTVEGGDLLIASTESQILAVKNLLDVLPENERFSTQIETNVAQFDQLNIELQKLTRFFKSDLSSLLGITITYSSSDGD